MNPDWQSIRELAYGLWQERGGPQGTPETDWFAAERQRGGAGTSQPAGDAIKLFPAAESVASAVPNKPVGNVEVQLDRSNEASSNEAITGKKRGRNANAANFDQLRRRASAKEGVGKGPNA